MFLAKDVSDITGNFGSADPQVLRSYVVTFVSKKRESNLSCDLDEPSIVDDVRFYVRDPVAAEAAVQARNVTFTEAMKRTAA